VGSDYYEDLRIGDQIIKYQTDAYRRLRNTLRYLLGALEGFEEADRVAPEEMPELERWVLHRVVELDAKVREVADSFEFHSLYRALHDFCAVDLSAFYFDIRKDSLYCDGLDSPTRRACLTVLDRLFDCLTAWLAPILCFTAEEAWWQRGKAPESVHLRTYPEVPAAWRDEALAEKWEKVRRVRRVVTGALELERAEKRIGSSLQASPTVYVADSGLLAAVRAVDLAEVSITSSIAVEEGEGPAEAYRLEDVAKVAVLPGRAEGGKCERCWKVLPEVGGHAEAPGTCNRCAEVVTSLAGKSEGAVA
jgi:isoleucyl-tRNA synthetase